MGVAVNKEIRLGEILTLCVFVFGLGTGFAALHAEIKEKDYKIAALEAYNVVQDTNARKMAEVLDQVLFNQQEDLRWRAAHQAIDDMRAAKGR